jgi:nucleoside-diphosphate-sugar epimerase
MINYLEKINNKKVLVTGGLGFVGHNLVVSLLKDYNCKVIVVDNCENSSPKILGDYLSEIEFHKISVLDSEKLFPLLDDVNYIFHLACIQIAASSKEAINDLRVNAESTLNILEYIRHNKPKKLERFVYTSSASVYGSSINNLPARENGSVAPLSHYAATKLLGETYTLLYNKLYDIPVSCVRYSNVYGYGQSPKNPYCGVLGKFIHNVINNQKSLIFGDGTQTRDYTFITDAINATILSAVHPHALGDMFNVGTGTETSVNELYSLISKQYPDSELEHIAERDIDNIRRRFVDIEKIHQRLGWTPRMNMEKGIEETINWYKNQ